MSYLSPEPMLQSPVYMTKTCARVERDGALGQCWPSPSGCGYGFDVSVNSYIAAHYSPQTDPKGQSGGDPPGFTLEDHEFGHRLDLQLDFAEPAVLHEGSSRVSVKHAVGWKPAGVEDALLGFDCRERFLSSARMWGAARRRSYLIQSAVQKPLSVDTMVWPSVFGDGLPQPERHMLDVNTFELPGWRGPNQGLWDDLSRMRASLGPLASVAHWEVAVSWISPDGFSKPLSGRAPYLERMTPPAIREDWNLLGFDVADAGLTSGLLNCGYEQTEITQLRASWASELNEHHLFADVTRALVFKDLTDRRVPEHAPFFVYGLFVVAKSAEANDALSDRLHTNTNSGSSV